MPATIGDISVFETLLGAKAVEKQGNYGQLMISMIQQDMAVLGKPKVNIEYDPISKQLSVIYELRDTHAYDDAEDLMKQQFPNSYGLLDAEKFQRPELGKATPDGFYWCGHYLTMKEMKVFIGIKVALR